MPPLTLTIDEQRQFLALARQSIHARLTHGPRPHLDVPSARAHLGAFVSLHVHGELRGCIGHPCADSPLGDVIARCAVSAAIEDPRFPPLTLAELAMAQIEISVLGPIEPVHDVSEIDVGRHGLILSQGFSKGLLLPQVATERGWDRNTFLSYTCRKAGLSPDAWKSGARIEKFEALVFSEEAAVA